MIYSCASPLRFISVSSLQGGTVFRLLCESSGLLPGPSRVTSQHQGSRPAPSNRRYMHALLGRLLNHCGGTISINTTWHHICQETIQFSACVASASPCSEINSRFETSTHVCSTTGGHITNVITNRLHICLLDERATWRRDSYTFPSQNLLTSVMSTLDLLSLSSVVGSTSPTS